MRESGFANFPAYQWFLVLAPAETPAAVIGKLNTAINEGLKSPDIQAQLAKLGTEPRIRSPQDLAKFMAGRGPAMGEDGLFRRYQARVTPAIDWLDPKQVWLAPDCSLMTISRELAHETLKVMVEAAKRLRAKLQGVDL